MGKGRDKLTRNVGMGAGIVLAAVLGLGVARWDDLGLADRPAPEVPARTIAHRDRERDVEEAEEDEPEYALPPAPAPDGVLGWVEEEAPTLAGPALAPPASAGQPAGGP